ncbi:MAG TPA: hypothetical protein VIU12_09010 [Chryseolinea sp.]
MENKVFSSLNELQREIPRILEKHGSDQSLAALALANPLLALRQIGYSFTPEAEQDIADHIRFGKANAAKVNELKASLHASTGHVITGDEVPVAAIEKILKQLPEKSKLKKLDAHKVQELFRTRPLLAGTKVNDPLETYAAEHPTVQQLVALRKLQATHAPLGSREGVEKIQKDTNLLKGIRFRLSRKK